VGFGYIPSVERLRRQSRRVHPWERAPWTDLAQVDTTGSARSDHRGLIFDLDDTLFPRDEFVTSGFAAVARLVAATHGVRANDAFDILTQAYEGDCRGRELQVLCEHFQLSHDIVPSLRDVFRRHLPTIALHPDAASALQALRAGGWRLGIVTGGLPSVQFRKVAALGLTALVDEVVYAEEHAAAKDPAVAAVGVVLKALELTAERCVCVTTSLSESVLRAPALGIRTLHVARSGAASGKADTVDMVIDSLSQVPRAAALILDMATADVA
jgi:putative hydrolase of the HAD superfamily